MSESKHPKISATDVAAGMGIPFRAILYLIACPFIAIILLVYAVCAPYSDEAGDALEWFPKRLWWVWHGRRRW